MGHVKEKGALKHAQNVQIQIILHMCQVSAGTLLFIHSFCSIQWADSEGPDQTAQISRLVWAFVARVCPKIGFAWCGPILLILLINLKEAGYTCKVFGPLLQGRKLLWLPSCFPAHQALSEKGSTLKGKNLLPWGANSLLLE